MLRILGIDPGSRVTGYGVVQISGCQPKFLTCGSIRVEELDFAGRLKQIFTALTEVIAEFLPHEAAIEQVFMHRNPNSALKLGQARGAAIVAMANQSLSVAEYSARAVKQAVVGYGAAEKNQVQQMVKMLLNLPKLPQADAADALAVAICHAHSRRTFWRKS